MNKKSLLTIRSSRISSFKSLFFPAKLDFFLDEKGFVRVLCTTRNWIGQKTVQQELLTSVIISGSVLRKIKFTDNIKIYGRFWSKDCEKVMKLIRELIIGQ